MGKADGEWLIEPQDLIADGESQSNIKFTLSFADQPVSGHNMTWRINRIWSDTGSLVYSADPLSGSNTGYGGLNPISGTTNINGEVETTYTSGTLAGTVEFAALDNSVVENSPLVYRNARRLRSLIYYVFADPSGPAIGFPSGNREDRRYSVVLRALLKKPGNAENRPDNDTITLLATRPVNDDQQENTGYLFLEDDPTTTTTEAPTTSNNQTVWTYRVRMPGWNITRERGWWEIGVKIGNTEPAQQTDSFKILKRNQIVEYARHWAGLRLEGQTQESDGGTQLFGDCHTFVAHVYNHLGLSIGSGQIATFKDATADDDKRGAIRFYWNNMWQTNLTRFNQPSHSAIIDGASSMFDNNNRLPNRFGFRGPSLRPLNQGGGTRGNEYYLGAGDKTHLYPPVTRSLPASSQLSVLQALDNETAPDN